MGKQKIINSKYSKIKNKIIENILLVILFLFTLFVFYLVVTKYQRAGEFQKESKSLRVCAIIENKYITQGNKRHGGNRPPTPVIIFKSNDLRCKSFPSSTDWAKYKVDQKYIIQGRATKIHCQVEMVGGSC